MLKFTVIFTAVLFTLPTLASNWSIQSGSARKALIKQQLNQKNAAISAADRQAKYAKMSSSAFVFYRGSAHLYYYDLNSQKVIAASNFSSIKGVTWLQGDMHVQNYGAFDDDTNTVVFDLNDFDESWIDNYLYDVYRATASLILVAGEQGFISPTEKQTIVDDFSEFYLDTLESYRSNNNEKSAKVKEANAYGRLDEFLADVAAKNSRKKMLDKWSKVQGAQRFFDLNNAGLLPVSSAKRTTVITAINQYYTTISSGLNGNTDYFKVLDVAKRINAGTGSLGTERYYVLIEGESSGDNDDRILDIKMQELPSIYPYLSSASQSRLLSVFSVSNQGCRVADAQKALLTDVDDHLGCTIIDGQSFSVRERSPFKASFDTEELNSMTRFTKLAQQWGSILATDHARADKDYNSELVPTEFETVIHDLTNGHHSEFRLEVFALADSYASQVQIDYVLFQQLYQAGDLD